MNREPVLTGAFMASLVSALLTLLVAFGLSLTPDQTAAVMGFAGIVAPVVAAYFARKKVTPTGQPPQDGLIASRKQRIN